VTNAHKHTQQTYKLDLGNTKLSMLGAKKEDFNANSEKSGGINI